jgi:hypothetical protein
MQEERLDSSYALPASLEAGIRELRAVLARRKPRLLLRLSGVLLFRLAQRALTGLLFHDPPRLTRLEPLTPLTLFLELRIAEFGLRIDQGKIRIPKSEFRNRKLRISDFVLFLNAIIPQ